MDTHAARARLLAEQERLEGVRQAADRLSAYWIGSNRSS